MRHGYRSQALTLLVQCFLVLCLGGCSGSGTTGSGLDGAMSRVDTPILEPVGGAYHSRAQVLVARCPTAGATLYVQRDGTTAPGSDGPVAIPLLQDTAVQAWAVKSGQADSRVVSASYTFDPNPTFAQAMRLDYLTYEGGTLSGARWFKVDAVSGDTLIVTVTHNRAGVGLEVYDAQQNLLATAPTTSDAGSQVTYDVTAGGTLYIRLFQTQGGLAAFGAGTVTYTLAVSAAPPGHVISPVFAPVAGTYAGPLPVYLLSPTEGATIYYTSDGTDPTSASTPYAGPIVVTRNTTLKAMAVKSGLLESRVSTAAYVITGSITGRVTNSQGQPVASANVSLDYDFGDLFPGGFASAVTALDGSYAIAGVPPGTYSITATHPQYLARTESVTVASSATVQRDLVLEWTMVKASKTLFKVWERTGMGQFAVGAAGRIVRSQDGGTTWPAMNSGVEGDLTAVWGCPATPDVYAVGNNGVILHYGGTGTDWERMTYTGTEDLYGVFGFSKSDIFAVGQHGVILHHDGTAWTRMTRPDSTARDKALVSVWGLTPTDVHAVGDAGRLIHYDGTRWTEFPRLVPNLLFAVYGFDSTHVYAVGGGDLQEVVRGVRRGAGSRSFLEGDTRVHILRFDGTRWAVVKDEPGPRLMTLWGTSPTAMYVGGADGKAYHFDGASLVDLHAPTVGWVLSIYGSVPGDFFAVGQNGVKLHYSGGAWTVLDAQDVQSLYGIWAASTSEIFAVGERVTSHAGMVLRSVDGGDTWSEAAVPAPTLIKVWGADANNVWAAGVAGSIVYWNGIFWVPQVFPGGANLWSIRGSGSQDVYAVGENGTVRRFDGFAWTTVTQPPGMAGKTLFAVYAFKNGAASDVFVAGEGGQIFHSTDSGSTWTVMPRPPGTETIQDIFGLSPTELYAVGKGGTCLYYHAGSWQMFDLDPGFFRAFYGVWGTGAAGVFDEVICVGHFVIFQYLNSTWRQMATGTQEPFVGVWGALVDPLDASKGLRAFTCTVGAGIYRHVRDH